MTDHTNVQNVKPQRRSARPNKGISAECLTYMVKAMQYTEPTSWQEKLQLLSDIKDSFFNRNIKEDLYLSQPDG